MQLDNISEPLGNVAWTATGELEVLTFDMGGQTFALEATLVREILDVMPETPVPGAPDLMGSVVNFRGKIIPLGDLRSAFHMEPGAVTPDSRIIVIELPVDGEPTLIGLKTDKVHEVATFLATTSEEAPVVGLRWPREFVRNLVRRGSDVVVLPDLQTILRKALGIDSSVALHKATS